MKRLTPIIAAGLLSLGLATTTSAQDDGARSMGELLKLIEQGQARDSREARQREATFAQNRNQQQSLLNQARAERTRQEENPRTALHGRSGEVRRLPGACAILCYPCIELRLCETHVLSDRSNSHRAVADL